MQMRHTVDGMHSHAQRLPVRQLGDEGVVGLAEVAVGAGVAAEPLLEDRVLLPLDFRADEGDEGVGEAGAGLAMRVGDIGLNLLGRAVCVCVCVYVCMSQSVCPINSFPITRALLTACR